MFSLQRVSLVGCLTAAFALAGCPTPSPTDTGGGTDTPAGDTPMGDGGPRDTPMGDVPRADVPGMMDVPGMVDVPGMTDVPAMPDTPPECRMPSDCPTPMNPCQMATCSAMGRCGMANVMDGTTCTDNDMCTSTDVCTAGVCGGTTVTCTTMNACMTPTCDPMTGCGETPRADGTACEDGNLCTNMDTCMTGTCTAGMPTVCVDDACDTEMCNPMTGACDLTPEMMGTMCASPMGGLCDGMGACLCSATELTCGGTCFASGACTAGLGACLANGMLICDAAGGAATACDAVPGTPGTETCNNIDDDCDGTVDAFSSACYSGPAPTRGVGACRDGMSLCTAGVPGACTGEVLPGREICGNGIDEDCSGADAPCTGGDTRPAATVINLSLPSQTLLTTTTGAANNTTGSCGCTSGPDMFYTFTLTQAEIVYATTAGLSTYDTSLFFQDSAGANIAAAGLPGGATCNDDSGLGCSSGLQSAIVARLAAGTYYLVLSGCGSGAAGILFQHVAAGGGPTAALVAGASMPTGTTSGASASTTTCGGGSGPENTYYWVTCGGSTGGAFTATTCSLATWDTVLQESSPGRATVSVCNDDTGGACGTRSTIASTIPAGAGLHVLYIDGFGGSSGAYTINVTRP